MRDKRELDITTTNEECIIAINLFEDSFLSYAKECSTLLQKVRSINHDFNLGYLVNYYYYNDEPKGNRSR
jgi:hypothetical protein